MSFIRLVYDKECYNFDYFDSAENIGILGLLLALDVRTNNNYRQYFHNEAYDSIGGNITVLQKNNNYVVIRDVYQDDKKEYPKEITISNIEFSKILDIWLDNICIQKPKEVIIKYENNEYIFETKD